MRRRRPLEPAGNATLAAGFWAWIMAMLRYKTFIIYRRIARGQISSADMTRAKRLIIDTQMRHAANATKRAIAFDSSDRAQPD